VAAIKGESIVYENANFYKNTVFGREPGPICGLRDRRGATGRTGKSATTGDRSHTAPTQPHVCLDAWLLGLAGPLDLDAWLLGTASASGRCLGAGPLGASRAPQRLGPPALAVELTGTAPCAVPVRDADGTEVKQYPPRLIGAHLSFVPNQLIFTLDGRAIL
jgi:hypothetical protein